MIHVGRVEPTWTSPTATCKPHWGVSPWVLCRYLWPVRTWSSRVSGWRRWVDTLQGTPPLPPASHSYSPARCRRVWSRRGGSPAGCRLWSPRCSRWRPPFWGTRWGRGAGLWRARPRRERKCSRTGWLRPSGRFQLQLGSYLRERERERVRQGRNEFCPFGWNILNAVWICTFEFFSTCDIEDAVVGAEGAVLSALTFPVDHDLHDLCAQWDVGGVDGQTGGGTAARLKVLAWDKPRRWIER